VKLSQHPRNGACWLENAHTARGGAPRRALRWRGGDHWRGGDQVLRSGRDAVRAF
jgi:hypothetical protein